MIDVAGYGECVLIGRGGVGEVYRSTRLSTGAPVAIKVLHHVSDESVAWRRTRRELAAMVELAGHAHVIGVIEVHDLLDGPALVMEFAPGGSVGELLASRSAPLELAESVFIVEHAAKALVAAHDRGIVHRDIKPHNLLIDGYGQVKLCDFGIASLARSDEFRMQTHAVSLRYASPEDLEGDVEAGAATDIYSLGATLLHLVHGAPPSLRERVAGWQQPVTNGVDEHDPDIADPVDAVNAVLAACLRADPAQRPTAAQVLDMLERVPLAVRCRSIVGAPPVNSASVGGALARDVVDSDVFDSEVFSSDVLDSDVVDVVGGAAASRAAGPGVPDTTVVRPSASSSSAPPADSLAGSRPTSSANLSASKRILLLALVATAVVGGGFILWNVIDGGSSADDVNGAAGVVRVVERPADFVELTLMEWPTGEVGQCLVQPPEGNALVPTDCDNPHDLQRVATGTVEPLANDALLTDAVAELCDAHWASARTAQSIVLPEAIDAVLRLSNVRPTWQAAAAGDAGYQCFVGVPGKRVAGTVSTSWPE